MGILKWLAGDDSILGGGLRSIGLGDMVESANREDLIGAGTFGLSRGLGRQVNELNKEISGENALKASEEASAIHKEAAEKGIEEQRAQFDILVDLMSDYVGAGKTALNQQLDLMGLGDPESQQLQIDNIKSGPQYQSMVEEGENAILSNASATGNLRGGNTKSRLSEFRPDLLSGLINERLNRLSSISGRGQNAASFQGASAVNLGGNVSNLLNNIGEYGAQNVLSKAKAKQEGMMNFADLIGQFGGSLSKFSFDGDSEQNSGQNSGGGY